MYQKKSNIQRLLLMLLDCGAIAVSLMVANYIRNGRLFVSDNERMDFSMLLAVCVAVFLGMNLFFDVYRDMHRQGPFKELCVILRNNLIILAGATLILYFVKVIDAYSRLVLIYFPLICCVCMFAIHQLWKKYLPLLYRYTGNCRKLLLVLDAKEAEKIIGAVRQQKDYSYELQGIVLLNCPEAGIGELVEGLPVVALEENLVEYCRAASLDEVLVCAARGQEDQIKPVMEEVAAMGITIHYRIRLFRLESAHQKMLTVFGGMYTITYANKLAPMGQLLLKRIMDIAGAVVGMALLAILTLIVGPLIKLESPGPVFFSQKRVGRNGRVFWMYKFRSMYVDAEARKAELIAENEMNGLMFKMENDPRITRIGKFLRKTSLDEFPQFLNILKGDMSLVGTRPPTLDEFAQYSSYHKKRLSFRPGLTGMWQVSGRSDITDFEEIVRLDVEYIDNWSFGLDIKILFKTIGQVLLGHGAK